MLFEWDKNKAAANIEKHGIDFRDALHVFEDPRLTDSVDERRDYGETRARATGMVDGVLLTVVFTPRGDALRLISARRANANDKKRYRRE